MENTIFILGAFTIKTERKQRDSKHISNSGNYKHIRSNRHIEKQSNRTIFSGNLIYFCRFINNVKNTAITYKCYKTGQKLRNTRSTNRPI